MKSILTPCLVLILGITFFCPPAPAAQKTRKNLHQTEQDDSQPIEQPFGLGIMLGDLNGISGKYWASPRNSYDGGFSYALNDYATLHADYLWSIGELFGLPGRQKKNGSLASPYFGIGPIAYFDTSRGVTDPNQEKFFQKLKSSGIALGARFPLGIEFQPGVIPCGFFGEFAPGVVLIPGMISILQAEAGVRFYI